MKKWEYLIQITLENLNRLGSAVLNKTAYIMFNWIGVDKMNNTKLECMIYFMWILIGASFIIPQDNVIAYLLMGFGLILIIVTQIQAHSNSTTQKSKISAKHNSSFIQDCYDTKCEDRVDDVFKCLRSDCKKRKCSPK